MKNKQHFKNAVKRLDTRLKYLNAASDKLFDGDTPGDLVVLGRRTGTMKWVIDHFVGPNANKPGVPASIREFITEALSGRHNDMRMASEEIILQTAGTAEKAYLQAALNNAVAEGWLGEKVAQKILDGTKEGAKRKYGMTLLSPDQLPMCDQQVVG